MASKSKAVNSTSNSKEEKNNPTSSSTISIVIAIIGLLGTLGAAYFAYVSSKSQIELPILATQTVEARLTGVAIPTQEAIGQTPTASPQLPATEIVFSDPNIYHLGDEDQWTPLVGRCKSFEFSVRLPIQEASLKMEIFDVDVNNDLIVFNDVDAHKFPTLSIDETWSEPQTFVLSKGLFEDGINRLEFCSSSDGNELDDFQIRNIFVEVTR